MASIFEHFQRQASFEVPSIASTSIYFQLNFDELGAFLKIVDRKGHEVEVSHLNYSGVLRNVVRILDQINIKNSFLIDWERTENRIYLAEHSFLLDLLVQCDNLVDAKMNPIKYHDTPGKIWVNIKERDYWGTRPTNPVYNSQVLVEHQNIAYSEFQLLGERMILQEGRLIKVEALGSNFMELLHFNTSLTEEELPIFLSILYSNLDNVALKYKHYRLNYSEDRIFARPCIIFEKIDIDKALLMRISYVLPNMDPDILQKFDLYRYAEINDLEKTISIKIIEQDSKEELAKKMNRLFKKLRGVRKEYPEVIQENDLFVIPQELAAKFIYGELPNLLTEFVVYGAEKLNSYKFTAKTPTLSLNISHSIDYFEGDVFLHFGDEKIGLFEALSQFNKQSYILLNDGTHALVKDSYMRKLERIFKESGNKASFSFFDLPLIEELIEEKTISNSLQNSREIFEGFNKLEEEKTNLPDINATLRPYQVEGYKWLQYLNSINLGGCLADDMGLGKTLQTITLLASIYRQSHEPTLIVMPRSLLFNWKSEVEKFAPQLSTYTFYGQDRDLSQALKANLIFSTYAIVRNTIEDLKDISFHYIILDESQNIKNINALTTKAIMVLKAEHRLALSGTPIENNLSELYSLFRFLNPTMFGTLRRFNRDYIVPIQKNYDKIAIQFLRKKIYPFVLRRLKRDVLKDLPDKIEQTLLIEMSEPQKQLYERRRQYYQREIKEQIAEKGVQKSRFFVFQALNELRQIASIPERQSSGQVLSPKRELLHDRLMDAIANGHKVLIFANFLSAIELIGEQLDKEGVDYVAMTGSTRDRQALVHRFQNDFNCKAFLMTLKTGGTGLNLTAADTIFIFDPWWNASAEAQAIDRAHRFGQKNKVLAYKLIAKDTIEEKILKLQELKKELFDNIISADGAGLKSLSEEDIDFILGSEPSS